MEMAMNVGAFEALNDDELMLVDGGASKFAVAVVNIGCSIIAGVVCAGAGALAGAACGGGIPGAIVGGLVGLVGGAVLGYCMADAITSQW